MKKIPAILNHSMLAGLMALTLLACSATRPPFDPIAQAHTQIAKAQMSKADVHAAAELAMAQDLIQHAEKALYNYDYPLAEHFAEEASAMADLASVKSRLLASSQDLAQAEQTMQTVTQTLSELNQRAAQNMAVTTPANPGGIRSEDIIFGIQPPSGSNPAQVGQAPTNENR